MAYTYSFYKPSSEKPVLYPDGYRNWTHVKTAFVGPQSPAGQKYGGFHHIYANDKAMEGYRTGKFPDGSVIVFDVFNAIENKSDLEAGERKFIDVMVRDTINYKLTGGWGFEEFAGSSKTERTLNSLSKVSCFNCHAAKKKNDFVFSTYKE
jgi:hypothetical protein